MRIGTAWKYVSAAPLTSIISPVLYVSKLIMLISIGGMLVALLFSLLASKRLYTPVDRLVRTLMGGTRETAVIAHHDEFDVIEKRWAEMSRESDSLRTKLEQQMPLAKEGFMLQLVQGYLSTNSEEEVRERMRHYIGDVQHKSFAMIMIQLAGVSHLEGRFFSGDEELICFMVINIIQEITYSKQVEAEVINFHDMSIGLLIMMQDESAAKFKEGVHQLCEELLAVIENIVKTSITISVSPISQQAKNIPHIYDETRQALVYRTLPIGSQVIDLELLNKSDSQRGFTYPFYIEKEIIHAIRMGAVEEADHLLEQFMEELSQGGSAELIAKQGMLQLLGSVLNAIVYAGINPVQLFQGVNLFEQLSSQKGAVDMIHWFRKRIVRVVVEELLRKQESHLKQMVEQVVVYLNENYMTGLSLESCADHYGLSPYTLSRAFKQIVGINFIDYLTNIRLMKAKQLLRESGCKITEVAEQVGYQQSYFNRIFKKTEGVTPSKYREMIRGDQA